MGWSYRSRHEGAASTEPKTEQNGEPEALPKTHADLDALAAERGHEWSTEGLTVAAKQAELGG